MQRTIASAFILALACAVSAAHAQAPVRAIVGATLVNPGAPPVPDAVVVVRDGRIAAAGPRARVAIPDGAERIDAAGKWLVPGYIDAHVHFFQSGGLYTRPDALDLQAVVAYARDVANVRANLDDTLQRTLRSGITTVVDFGGPMWNFDVRAHAATTAKSPDVAVAGPLIATWRPPVVADAQDPPILLADTPERARALVREQAAHRPDFIKVWFVVNRGETPAQFLPTVKAAIDEAHARGLRAAVHATELETARAAVDAGADVLVHSVEDKPLDAALLAKLRERGIAYVPTLAVGQGYERVFAKAPALDASERAWGSPDAIASFDDLNKLSPDYLPAWLPQAWARGFAPRTPTVAMANLKAAQDAGVRVAAGTDAGNIGTLHGASYFRELRLMTESGLTPAQVLSDATLGGAQLLKREADLGTIETGKRADMVLLDADPLADVGNLARIYAVVKRGVVLAADAIVDGRQIPLEREADAFRALGPGDQPEAVVQRQLDAYNARDVEAFVGTYASDAALFDFPGGEANAKGLDAMRAQYGAFFAANPKLHCDVRKRIVQGRFVIDHEHVTGLANGASVDAVAIYEVRGGKIRRVWFIQ